MEKVKQLLNELLTRRPDGHAGLHGCLGGPPRHSADGLGTPGNPEACSQGQLPAVGFGEAAAAGTPDELGQWRCRRAVCQAAPETASAEQSLQEGIL